MFLDMCRASEETSRQLPRQRRCSAIYTAKTSHLVECNLRAWTLALSLPLLRIEHSMHFYPSHVFKDNFSYYFQLMNRFSTCYYTLNSLLPTTLQPHLHLLRTTFVLGLDTDA